MLHLISRDHGRELSAAISEMFVYERIRNEQDHQRVPLKHMLGTNQPKLQEIVALMEANLEEPIDLDELARSEEHTSELQFLMRISYADICFKKQTHKTI